MKIKNWMLGLFVALGIGFIPDGFAHADEYAHIQTNSPANMSQSHGCSRDSGNKYRCSGSFMLAVSGGFSSQNGGPYVCHFSGYEQSSGFSDQNWVYTLYVGDGSSPAGACSLSKLNGNTWDARIDFFYGKSSWE
jgi:hypothetical protein